MAQIPIKSDRAARDSLNYPAFHASDLEAGTPVQHLPTVTEGQFPQWDGSKYVGADITGSVVTRYTHTQSVPSDTWNIAHNLGVYPVVVVVDSGGTVVLGDILYVDLDNITITFAAGFGGKAYLT